MLPVYKKASGRQLKLSNIEKEQLAIDMQRTFEDVKPDRYDIILYVMNSASLWHRIFEYFTRVAHTVYISPWPRESFYFYPPDDLGKIAVCDFLMYDCRFCQNTGAQWAELNAAVTEMYNRVNTEFHVSNDLPRKD